MEAPPRIRDAEWLDRAETQAVFAAIAAGGFLARAVGGSVRNALMGLPVTDTDFATDAPPETVMRLAEAAGLKPVPTGLKHGTVTVVAGHVPYEVTTLRRDVETDGRHATVAFTDDWQADASRRDFTMNALYCDADGTIFDPLGAYPDLAARRVRFIGDPIARIREDYLRVLRFFRFNAAYGAGPFDQAGLVACARERAGLARLSAERIRSELVRLLVAPRAAAALQVMLEWDLLLPVIGRVPYLAAFRRVTAIEEELDSTPDAMLRLAALAVRIPEDVDYLADRLRLSNVEHAALLDHVHAASKAVPKLACDMTELAAKAVLYRLGPDGFRRRVLFAWLLSRAPVNDQEWQQLLTLPDRWEAPKLPVSGRHLAAAGVAPGPGMGELLRALEQDWIDGGFVATREQLLAAAKRLSAAPRP